MGGQMQGWPTRVAARRLHATPCISVGGACSTHPRKLVRRACRPKKLENLRGGETGSGAGEATAAQSRTSARALPGVLRAKDARGRPRLPRKAIWCATRFFAGAHFSSMSLRSSLLLLASLFIAQPAAGLLVGGARAPAPCVAHRAAHPRMQFGGGKPERQGLTRDTEPEEFFATNMDDMTDAEKIKSPVVIGGLALLIAPFIVGAIALAFYR